MAILNSGFTRRPRLPGGGVLRAALMLSCTLGLLSACGTPPSPEDVSAPRSTAAKGIAAAHRMGAPRPDDFAAAVRVVEVPSPLQCVPYARLHSKVALRGNAGTWWDAAAGLYERGRIPQQGAVLVLKQQRRSQGHLAVVTRVVDDRIVLANHANWLNRGRIFENTPIRDVSSRGDWSAVRIWYPPAQTWGRTVYSVHGFIYGDTQRADAR